MANFVTNIVHFDGDPERILDLRGAVQDDQYGMSGIDFNKIIPMPSGLWMGGINPDTRAKYGKNNWLDWSIANWGTKWNAFRFDDDDQYSDSQITFVTANNAPAPIMQKLSKMYPEITMHHFWAEDNVGHNCGERVYKAGSVIEEFKPDMCGIGPFIPHKDTVFADRPAGTLELTCYLLSIIRLIHPPVLLPATTALGTIHPEGRELGILSGANVVMPNLSPPSVRKKYMLYNDKVSDGAESAQSKAELVRRMTAIGYEVVVDRGDARGFAP